METIISGRSGGKTYHLVETYHELKKEGIDAVIAVPTWAQAVHLCKQYGLPRGAVMGYRSGCKEISFWNRMSGQPNIAFLIDEWRVEYDSKDVPWDKVHTVTIYGMRPYRSELADTSVNERLPSPYIESLEKHYGKKGRYMI